MNLKELLEKFENGSHHFLIYDSNGLILYHTIWYNLISKKDMNREVVNYQIEQYHIRAEIE